MQRLPAGLAPVVYIPGLVYETILRARNGLYSASLLKQKRLPAPVISIGNITMGGTGKTPLVIHIARIVARLGFCPAILTRGYGRPDAGGTRILAPEERIFSPAEILGDEPALIRRYVPCAFLGLSPHRFPAGDLIAKRIEHPVFILDDGFQHRRLARDLDIVVIDSGRGLEADRIFPRGTLREPLSELRRCHSVMINETQDSSEAERAIEEVRRYHPGADFFRCRQRIRTLIPFPAWLEENEPQTELPSSAYLVAAVGNPRRFEEDIRALGIEVRGTEFFRDHFRPSPGDWAGCAARARREGADAIILTEKDAIKLSAPPDFPLLVAVQSTEISDGDVFETALKKCTGERV